MHGMCYNKMLDVHPSFSTSLIYIYYIYIYIYRWYAPINEHRDLANYAQCIPVPQIGIPCFHKYPLLFYFRIS